MSPLFASKPQRGSNSTAAPKVSAGDSCHASPSSFLTTTMNETDVSLLNESDDSFLANAPLTHPTDTPFLSPVPLSPSTMSLPCATLTNDDPTKKVPRVSAGSFDAALLREMFEAYDKYADMSAVHANKIVSRIVKNIKDHVVVRWYRADEEHIRKLSLEALKKELRDLLLDDADWEITIVREIRHTRQKSTESLITFYYRVCEKNRLLEGTTSHLDDNALHSHIHASMVDPLLVLYEEENVRLNAIADFGVWLKEVETIDKKRTNADKDRNTAIAAFMATQQRTAGPSQSNKHMRDVDDTHRGSKKAPRNNENANLHAATSSSVDPANSSTPTMDAAAAAKPFIFHFANDNVCDFPPPDAPKVMEATIVTAKATLTAEQRAKLGNATKGKGKGKAAPPVASTLPAVALRAPAVTMVIADFSNDNDDVFSSDSENSDLSHRGHAAHTEPSPSQAHLYFDCLVEGSRRNLPIPTRGLIDNGSFLVLIDEDLVEHVGLQKHRLHEPIPFNSAFTTADTSPSSPPCATEYVKLHLFSHDHTYSTKPVRAHIVPNLCAPILLGLPFLWHHHITIDHYRRTVIDEIKNYDLVNPVTPPQKPKPKKKLKHSEEFKLIQKQRKLLAEELHTACDAQRERLDAEGLLNVNTSGLPGS
ncbi:hypothetical protein C8F01DRAFT_1257743 [Mycena amicta]|nr:hypothetical protein C8F01DRAFT_1257743 [Mycena amicta]